MGRGITIGVAIGAALALLLTAVGTMLYTSKRASDLRRGWNAVPLVTTAHAVKRGARIGPGDLVGREMPEQFATDDALRPADLGRANQQVLAVDLPANTLVYWGDLESEQPTSEQECVRRSVSP